MIEKFLNLQDHRRYFLSDNELQRRWKAVRERMAERGIDYLVIQSQQRYVGGYARWFTDIAVPNYPLTCIFPREDEMTLIAHGAPAPSPPSTPPEWALRGVKERINVPAFPNVWWEDSWDAEKCIEVIMRGKPKVVGLVGLGNMSAAIYENLKKGLNGVDVLNATDIVDEVRMVKSDEELILHREAAYLHELSYEAAKKAIRPGRTASEVIREIRQVQVEAGSEEQQIMITFHQPGEPPYMQASWGNVCIRRPLKKGDIVNLLIESSAPGGYWYDLRRFLCIGHVPSELKEAYEIAREARRLMEKALIPGRKPAVALEASDEYLMRNGCPAESRVAGHGQGLDLVERPVIRREEPATLKAGMVVSLHPTARTKHATASLSDTYVISNSGAVPLYKNLFEDVDIAVVE